MKQVSQRPDAGQVPNFIPRRNDLVIILNVAVPMSTESLYLRVFPKNVKISLHSKKVELFPIRAKNIGRAKG